MEAELVDPKTGLLLPVVMAFFLTTSDPSVPRPLRVPTLLSQLSNLARFTPAAEVSYKDKANWVNKNPTLVN